MAHYSRRDFLKTGLAAGALLGTGNLPVRAATRGTATEWVTLGKSGVKVTRLAFGTGTFAGRTQRQLGQDEFTRQVRYAYDHGIRFFETAESYGEMHKMLGIALKGIPRDSYRLMSKVTTRPGVDPQEKIDELRKLANTDYFDIMLLHWQHVATWPRTPQRWQDGVLEAKHKDALIGYGASVHGLPALRQVPRQQVAPDRDDPHEPQRHQDGRRGLRHPRTGQRARSGHARQAGAAQMAWASSA